MFVRVSTIGVVLGVLWSVAEIKFDQLGFAIFPLYARCKDSPIMLYEDFDVEQKQGKI